MTTRVTCTNPDGCFVFGRPVKHDESIEVDDEVAAVLDPEQWKVGRTTKPKAAANESTTTDDDKEQGQ